MCFENEGSNASTVPLRSQEKAHIRDSVTCCFQYVFSRIPEEQYALLIRPVSLVSPHTAFSQFHRTASLI